MIQINLNQTLFYTPIAFDSCGYQLNLKEQ